MGIDAAPTPSEFCTVRADSNLAAGGDLRFVGAKDSRASIRPDRLSAWALRTAIRERGQNERLRTTSEADAPLGLETRTKGKEVFFRWAETCVMRG